MKPINANDFKARCLEILDRVAATGEPVVVLKRGRPVAELCPATGSSAAYPQSDLKNTVVEVGDIVAPAVPADHWDSAHRQAGSLPDAPRLITAYPLWRDHAGRT